MAEVIVGTAGHVDHGKTALIRALTGQDTDRLPEERRRGISIDLGFAEFVLPSGRRAGVVDVPGHERFIRNMVAGATGMDLVLLVVAADEGVMPQTVEHLDILRLLGVEAGAVVLTKVDLVDGERLAQVEEQVRQAVRGTFLEGAPRVRVSSVTGEGLDELRAVVDRLIPQVRGRPVDAYARLPIDRAFVVPGFGPVVTGTLAAGRIACEDRLELLPAGQPVRARQVQVHGRPVAQAVAGQRVAVNLAGAGGVPIQRGDVLATPGVLEPTDLLALRLELLPHAGAPLRSGTRLRLHTGTVEVIGRLLLLEGAQLEPGGVAMALFRAERPLVAARGDRFIVRTYSPMRTIGGGLILDTGRPYRRRHPDDLARLAAFAKGDPAAAALAELAAAGGPVPVHLLGRRLLWTPRQLEQVLARLEAAGEALRVGEDHAVAAGTWAALREACRRVLAEYHEREPLRPGMPREELRRAVAAGVEPRAFAAVVARLAAEGAVAVEGDVVRLPDFRAAAGEAGREVQRVLEAYRAAGLAAPAPAELAGRLGMPAARLEAALRHLVAAGRLVRLAPDLYVAREAYEAAARAVARRIRDGGPATAAELRDVLGVSRKYAIPLLESLDRDHITRRLGDRRVLTPRGLRWAGEGEQAG